jgi:hypothetical protein
VATRDFGEEETELGWREIEEILEDGLADDGSAGTRDPDVSRAAEVQRVEIADSVFPDPIPSFFESSGVGFTRRGVWEKVPGVRLARPGRWRRSGCSEFRCKAHTGFEPVPPP